MSAADAAAAALLLICIAIDIVQDTTSRQLQTCTYTEATTKRSIVLAFSFTVEIPHAYK